MIWGSNYWLYGTVGLETVFTKILANNITPTGESYRNVTKLTLNSIDSTSVVGKFATKSITNTVANTSTIGKLIQHYYANTIANTSAVGKHLTHYYANNQEVTGTISPNMVWNRSFDNSISVATEMAIYKYRSGYEVIYGGQGNVVNYPRGSSYTTATNTSTSWASTSISSTSWS